jgi:hypothetical protein
MVGDALAGTPWNTVHWAVANLHHATQGKHRVFDDLAGATETELAGQPFLQRAMKALRENDAQTLARYVTAPSKLYVLRSDDPHYTLLRSLWRAAASLEASIG